MSTIVDEGGEPPTPTATTPSMMSSTTAPSSTAATSPPLSPKNAGGDDAPSTGLIDAADVHKLRLDLKAAVEAQHNAETRASVLEAELGRFKDQFTFAHAAKEALEQQLREEITRREKAEEKVELLRGQVEQARRGVMQLQKQESDRAARRQSVQLEPEESTGTTSTAKKRQSLYLGTRRPLSSQGPGAEEPTPTADKPPSGLRELRLGGGHARGKSINLRAPPLNVDVPPSPHSPRRPSASPVSPRHSPPAMSPPRTSEDKSDKSPDPTPTPDFASASSAPLAIPPPVARRASSTSQSGAGSFVSAASATTSVLGSSPQTLPATNEHIEQLKAARVETAALRAQIEALEMKLAEADEAREASEECLRAFREFLAADPEAGPGTVSLPPLPSEIDDNEPAPEPVQEKKGWGFGGLFRADSQGPQEGKTMSRRGSTASTSPSIAVSPPAIAEVLTPVFENEDKEDKDKDVVPDKDKDLPKSPPPSAPSAGWLAGWRSTSTAAPPEPEPAVEEPQPQQGANLGRSLTSFFGRRARAASRAAQRAEENKVGPEAEAGDGHDAPLASQIAAEAAAESSTFGLQLSRLPPSESEGSLKTLAARADLAAAEADAPVPAATVTTAAATAAATTAPTTAPAERSSNDLDPAARVAAAKAKAEALAAERAEKRRHRAERISPQASAASSPVRPSQAATASPVVDLTEEKEKEADEDSALAYLAEPAAEAEGKPDLVVETAPAASNAVLSPGSATSPSFGFDPAPAAGIASPLRSPSLPVPAPSSPAAGSPTLARPRRSSSLSSPISPALSARRSPSPSPAAAKDEEEEELADEPEEKEEQGKQEKEKETDGTVNGAPKRPQRRNASRRGRGGAKVRGGARGGFV